MPHHLFLAVLGALASLYSSFAGFPASTGLIMCEVDASTSTTECISVKATYSTGPQGQVELALSDDGFVNPPSMVLANSWGTSWGELHLSSGWGSGWGEVYLSSGWGSGWGELALSNSWATGWGSHLAHTGEKKSLSWGTQWALEQRDLKEQLAAFETRSCSYVNSDGKVYCNLQ